MISDSLVRTHPLFEFDESATIRFTTPMSLKSQLKRVRSSQPLNQVTTATLKRIFDITNWHPEFAIKHLPRVGQTSVMLPDGKFLLLDSSGEDWIPTQLFWRGWLGYEPEVTPLFYRLAQKANVVFDIGAHIGFFSTLAGKINPQARVYAFEPLPRVYERLERNVALNGLTNVECILAAAGKEGGSQEFYFPDEHAPVSSSLRSDILLTSLGEKVVRHLTVSVVTLDSFVARNEINQIDLIKMDTERTEHDVILGSTAVLARDHPDIICEVWPDADNISQLEALLSPYNYLFYQLMPEGCVRRETIQPSANALNYLFTTDERKVT